MISSPCLTTRFPSFVFTTPVTVALVLLLIVEYTPPFSIHITLDASLNASSAIVNEPFPVSVKYITSSILSLSNALLPIFVTVSGIFTTLGCIRYIFNCPIVLDAKAPSHISLTFIPRIVLGIASSVDSFELYTPSILQLFPFIEYRIVSIQSIPSSSAKSDLLFSIPAYPPLSQSSL